MSNSNLMIPVNDDEFDSGATLSKLFDVGDRHNIAISGELITASISTTGICEKTRDAESVSGGKRKADKVSAFRFEKERRCHCRNFR